MVHCRGLPRRMWFVKRRLSELCSVLCFVLAVVVSLLIALSYSDEYYFRFVAGEHDILLRPAEGRLKVQVATLPSRTSQYPEVWVEQLSNNDISWNGGTFGYMPEAAGEPAVRLAEIGSAAIPSLFAALDDPRKFAAAHVLLTW